MNRDELLDEAISKAKEAGDLQLADWLRTARGSNEASRWYTKKLRDLQYENAELRELVSDMWRMEDVHLCEHCPVIKYGCVSCTCAGVPHRMRQLGIEVEE